MNDLCYQDVIINGRTEQRKIIGWQKVFDTFGDVNREEYEPVVKLKRGETCYKDMEGKYHIRKNKNI